jgi:monoterpene epsilon-lactone hydrolase
MPNQAVADVVARLKSGGQPADLQGWRSQFDAVAGGQSMPDDARFQPIMLGGVPAERVTVAAAEEPGVVMFFHGGGYMFGSSLAYRALTAILAAVTRVPLLAINYRLAPEHPFPAAVEDTTAAYRAILQSGTPASRIGFAGDSAGGGLVIATMLSARDAGLPMPAAGYGMSSWLDLSCEGKSFTELAAVDPLMTAEGARGCAAAYLQGSDARHPWASPVHADFTGLPPLMLQVGSTEMFLDDSTRAARTAALAGVHVEMQVWPDMPHVWHLWPSILPEAAAALAAGGRFLRERIHGNAPSRL